MIIIRSKQKQCFTTHVKYMEFKSQVPKSASWHVVRPSHLLAVHGLVTRHSYKVSEAQWPPELEILTSGLLRKTFTDPCPSAEGRQGGVILNR
jgi:hypothetical protein